MYNHKCFRGILSRYIWRVWFCKYPICISYYDLNHSWWFIYLVRYQFHLKYHFKVIYIPKWLPTVFRMLTSWISCHTKFCRNRRNVPDISYHLSFAPFLWFFIFIWFLIIVVGEENTIWKEMSQIFWVMKYFIFLLNILSTTHITITIIISLLIFHNKNPRYKTSDYLLKRS